MKEFTVKKFIEALKKAKDIDIAPVEFWVGEKEYELDSISQFGIMANVMLHFKEADKSILQPAVLQKKMRKKAANIVKKIKKDNRKK